ncbi:MAG: NAD(P)/FAD-dependent oxidoreductase [Negativicoccus succinicivorans]|uniref:NAD(P)/FAD-dependent oxidoreductase n=1 Tax=Negativicoccus succinicivorans TaxID=620903 RepID=UPI0026EA7084|nr:NAD(P)/FAD-dependent oxidoreductase [Negativicoccus succinicivorans]MBS5887162.1 NAD(P)/FAD-dependent oxidoreductase [Negativicoccus succinicivorans]
MRNVVVIGGGCAGQMAAYAAQTAGARVILLEKMPQLGLKMGITGKGRCNLTNAASMEELIRQTPGNGKFLYSAYHTFTNTDLLSLLASWGVKTKVERGGRVFPESDSAQEVRRAFRTALTKAGVEVHTEASVREIHREGTAFEVTTAERTWPAEAVIMTTGGASYPQTGSDGSGHELAKGLGHTLIPLCPSLIPLVCEEAWCKALQGLSLRNVELTLHIDGKAKQTLRGEMLFTHFGVSGPIVLRLSDAASRALQKNKKATFSLNVKPALTSEVLDARLRRDLEKNHLQQMSNALRDLLPQRLIAPMLQAAGIESDVKAAELSRAGRLRLGHALQNLSLTVTGTRPLREAIVTAGGISTKEVNPKTMESKIVPGIYFAGEILDVHAFTGGYNLQAAFSTGYLAGVSAAGKESEQ